MRIKRSRCLFIAIAVFIVFYRSQTLASLPVCLVPGVEADGPVIIASITAVDLNSTKSQVEFTPTVTLHVEEYLRGPHFESDAVRIPIDWTLGPSQPYAKRRPVWYDVVPSVGTRVLLTLFSDRRSLYATCAVESESIAETTPFVKSMISLRSLPEEERATAMEKALTDSSIAVRELAIDYLTSPKVSDASVRLRVFEQFAPVALDKQSNHRVEAVEAIRRSYDGFNRDSDVNYKILSFLVDLMSDTDQLVRSIAIQTIYAKCFGAGKNRPDLSRIRFKDRSATLSSLKRDVVAKQPFADQAAAIVGEFGHR